MRAWIAAKAPHPNRQQPTPVGTARQKLDDIGAPGRGIESQTDSATGQTGTRRIGHVEGKIHGDRGIGGIATDRQNVPADHRGMRLVSGRDPGETGHNPGFKAVFIAAGGQNH